MRIIFFTSQCQAHPTMHAHPVHTHFSYTHAANAHGIQSRAVHIDAMHRRLFEQIKSGASTAATGPNWITQG